MSVEIVFVEDSPGDVRQTQEAFRAANPSVKLHVVQDGVKAMAFLRNEGTRHSESPRPHLILLDLKLPKMDRREVLAAMRADPRFDTIPRAIRLKSVQLESSYVMQPHPGSSFRISRPRHWRFSAFRETGSSNPPVIENKGQNRRRGLGQQERCPGKVLAEYSQTDGSPAKALPNQRTGGCCIDRLSWHALPDISNNVGSVKLFLRAFLPSLRGACLFAVFFYSIVDDHGSPVI
jgi:chemotaxis family two-component system response regulator Rcp1